ncbi:MAG: SufE family protein [Ardenticatenaceae bacterium]|nr:SufE family protein [Anaerolineales bacterium]MCB8921586.1 SufE family protein [Ardenticatenaceae bacterium]MCB9003877.1 SufE family protein [Ardenticatenaceae bacterium]
MDNLPPKLYEIVEDFSYCQGQEKLEYLLEFAEKLPPLPERYQSKADEHMVHECMSPVFVYAEAEDGRINYFIDAPHEAPTVRGFASVLHKGLNGLTPKEIQAIPNEFYLKMGLQTVLSSQRLNGISAMLRYMKQLATSN